MESLSTPDMSGSYLVPAGQATVCRALAAGTDSQIKTWELSGTLTPSAPVQRILIAAQPFTIGRDCDNALQLANPTISRRHAEMMLMGSELFVRDLDSRNGTFLNGRRVQNFELLHEGDMVQFGAAVFTVRAPRTAGTGPRTPVENLTIVEQDIGDYALANLQFDKLLADPAVIPFFQPIFRLGDSRPVGYEVLVRSRLVGLETPQAMFRVAAERNQEPELSELARREGMRAARRLGLTGQMYLNTHPSELKHDRLIGSLRQLRKEYTDLEMVLEIHESSVTSWESLAELRVQLRDLGIRLAYDDFGVGQSRLMELADAPPDVIKFDMCLIRGLARASEERKSLVRSLVQLVHELGVTSLAEGVETREEATACTSLGFELAQGYFFGRPTPSPGPAA
jgi:EAL domain-containing protein (putative c-di-GMP-specific phosphodiesterase class I)